MRSAFYPTDCTRRRSRFVGRISGLSTLYQSSSVMSSSQVRSIQQDDIKCAHPGAEMVRPEHCCDSSTRRAHSASHDGCDDLTDSTATMTVTLMLSSKMINTQIMRLRKGHSIVTVAQVARRFCAFYINMSYNAIMANLQPLRTVSPLSFTTH